MPDNIIQEANLMGTTHSPNLPQTQPNSPNAEGKTLLFAVAIIIALGCLALAGIGMAGIGAQQGWFHTARLIADIGFNDSIIMILIGTTAGTILLAVTLLRMKAEGFITRRPELESNSIQGINQHPEIEEEIDNPFPFTEEDQIPYNEDRLNLSPNSQEINPMGWQALYPELSRNYASIESGRLIEKGPSLITRQNFFRARNWKTHPPVISKSAFVPDEMTLHLMERKKDSALGQKYNEGDEITNMEGAMHTFVTPIGLIHQTADYAWKGRHSYSLFDNGKKRQVVLSAAIQPDFEYENVMLKVIGLSGTSVEGKQLPRDFAIPSAEQKRDPDFRAAYDEELHRHMVYHLTSSHSLPAKQEVIPMEKEETVQFLEQLIQSPDFDLSSLQNKYAKPNTLGDVISLEVLFQTYVHQLRNELYVFEGLLPQGYIYSIDPPSIFVRYFDDARLLNRFQILAIKYHFQNKEFENLKVIAFNDYTDKPCVDLLENAVGNRVSVKNKASLYQGPDQTYSPNPIESQYCMIVHNNSDGFGQNIETEGKTSMDGIIGNYSDAALVLKRDRDDLLNIVVDSND